MIAYFDDAYDSSSIVPLQLMIYPSMLVLSGSRIDSVTSSTGRM